MPIFEFKCKKCGHKFEYLASNSSDNPSKCPKCGKKNPIKQLSVFSAVDDGSSSSGSSCSTGTCPF